MYDILSPEHTYDRAAQALGEHLHPQATYPLPIKNSGTHAASPGSDLPTTARHSHDFEFPDDFCPRCQPRAYAQYAARHRRIMHDGKWSLPRDLGRGYFNRPYLGRVVQEGWPNPRVVGTGRQDTLAHLAEVFPENIYFVDPEVLS